jgi:hypothetical protein
MTGVPGRDAPFKTGDDAAAAASSVDQYPAAAKAEQWISDRALIGSALSRL